MEIAGRNHVRRQICGGAEKRYEPSAIIQRGKEAVRVGRHAAARIQADQGGCARYLVPKDHARRRCARAGIGLRYKGDEPSVRSHAKTLSVLVSSRGEESVGM